MAFRRLLVLLLVLSLGCLTFSAVNAATIYNEAPRFAEMVEAGALPPVEERLPTEPAVVEVVNEIGQYGGTYRGIQLGDGDRWVISKTGLYAGFVKRTYRDMHNIDSTGMTGYSPGMAKSWEWADDATSLTIYLREGLRWSDGEPFTADDIMFWWYDIEGNPEYQPRPALQFQVDGVPMEVTKLDEYSVRFDFHGPNPWIFDRFVNGGYAPKHYLSQYHPGHNPDATWDQFTSVNQIINVDRPTMAPFKLVRYNPAEEAVLERNPYYWSVDEAGNQLPYLDGMRFTIMGSQEAAILRGLAGDIDVAERQFQSLPNLPMLQANQELGDYTVNLWRGSNFTAGTEVWFNYDFVNKEDPIRELLRTPEFRNALSIGADRRTINRALYLGMARPANLGIGSSSPFWDDEMAEISMINAEFDPEKAGALLAGLGLEDRNGDGWLQHPDGQRVTFILGAASEIDAHVSLAELLVDDWRRIGIYANLDVQTRPRMFTRMAEGDFHAVTFGTQGVNFPPFFQGEGTFMPGYQGKDRVTDPPEDLVALYAIAEAFLKETDPEKALALMKEHQRLRAENNLGMWTASDVPIIGYVNNRMGNVPVEDILIDSENHLVLMPEQWYIKY